MQRVKIVRLNVPDGVLSLIKYVMAETGLKQEDVMVTLLQMAEAAVPMQELPATVKEIYNQTQAKIKMDQAITAKEGE